MHIECSDTTPVSDSELVKWFVSTWED